jgi:hypothetical protein
MIKSEQTNEIAAALAKAQATIKPPAKSKTVKVQPRQGAAYSFNYCDLADLIEAVRGPLTANGISYSFTTDHADGVSFLETHLLHSSGQFIGSRYPIHLNGNAQANGSELTYAKRYSLSGLVGIAAEDDDDGNGASGNDAKITDRQRTAPPRQQPPKQAADPLADAVEFKKQSLAAFKARKFNEDQTNAALSDWMERNELKRPSEANLDQRRALIAGIGRGELDTFKQPVAAA